MICERNMIDYISELANINSILICAHTEGGPSTRTPSILPSYFSSLSVSEGDWNKVSYYIFNITKKLPHLLVLVSFQFYIKNAIDVNVNCAFVISSKWRVVNVNRPMRTAVQAILIAMPATASSTIITIATATLTTIPRQQRQGRRPRQIPATCKMMSALSIQPQCTANIVAAFQI